MAVLLAASLSPFAGCGNKGAATDFSLKLHPDSSCASAPVACVNRLNVNLRDPQGAPLGSWNLAFSITGNAQSLGNLPNHGQGRFRVQGVATATTASVLVFSGTSGTVTFDPKNNQSVLVNVSCPAIADPCGALPTPTPTPPLFVSGTSANLVLGQTTFTACGNGVTTDSQLNEPEGLCVNGNKVFISDYQNARAAVWTDKTTLTNGQRIDLNGSTLNGFVIGHSQTNIGGSGGILSDRMNAARDVAVITTSAVFVVDGASSNGNRVGIWNPIPVANNAAMSWALGQQGTGNNASGNANNRLNAPWGVAWSATSGLFVADQGNNRVLGYGTDTAAFFVNLAPATLVLGQAAFGAGTKNAGNGTTVSGAGMDSPRHVATDGKRLYVSDFNNNRVLVWLDVKSAVSGQAADFAIGQASLTTNAAGTGTAGLTGPMGIAATKDRLVIADSGNNRVLLWQPPPTSSADPATQVIGQIDFTTVTPNTGGAAGNACNSGSCPAVPRSATAASLNAPGGVWLDGNDLWVSDTCNHRALRYTAH